MAIAASVAGYLKDCGTVYTVMKHRHSSSSLETAEAAHVPGHRLAKPVVLKDDQGYVLAVIPATNRARLGVISRLLHRQLGLADEADFAGLFKDCEIGAVPIVGQAYDIEVIWDDELADQPSVYGESGDHETLIGLENWQFKKLMQDVRHGPISNHI
jgi:Ala-tRNA(Pro) deacylase